MNHARRQTAIQSFSGKGKTMKKKRAIPAQVRPVVKPSVNDFVFIDDLERPYRVKLWGADEHDLWLFYWGPDKQWVALRPIHKAEALMLLEGALPKDQAALYETYPCG
jgi:hypothetical protein